MEGECIGGQIPQVGPESEKKIFEHFWDDDRKVFINGTMNDNVTVDKRISHHAQYWGILADIFPEEHYDNLFENVLPNLPNYYEVVSYEKGYEFLAYAKAGRIKSYGIISMVCSATGWIRDIPVSRRTL